MPTAERIMEQQNKIVLTAIEARVLGCLMEKESTTPESYPLTLNAVVTACNQKTSREPVMKLEPGQVGQALRQLENKRLVHAEPHARAMRYEHRADRVLKLTPAQRAILCVLMLRGLQTAGEIHARSERIHRFDDVDDVLYALERLAGHEPPLTVKLPRGPGQREDRYAHLLCGPVKAEPAARARPVVEIPDTNAELIERIEALEARVAALEEQRSL